MFILRRGEGQCSFAASYLVTGGGEHHLALPVLECQPLSPLIDIKAYVAVFDFAVTDIEPIGQVALCRTLSILNAHGVTGYGGYGEPPLSEGDTGGRHSRKADGQQGDKQEFSHG